ncbi:hypothetical protein EDB19DRAFT_1978044 [Suillus lakei]|nr:hypothetical protein EDB19DRAFT_1978044 [Suillus lakei]
MQSETDVFITSEWLSCGHVFEWMTLPPSVKCKIKCLLAIPAPIQSTIPSQTLSITQLLDINLPASLDCKLDSNTITFSSCLILACVPDLDDVLSWTVPPLHIVTKLLDQFGQAWFDGQSSVIHPSAPSTHLPFWTLSYWKEVSHALKAHIAWLSTHDWVLDRLDRDEHVTNHSAEEAGRAIDEVLDVLGCLPWDVELRGLGASVGLHTSELRPLLSNTMIDGHVLDALIVAINESLDDSNSCHNYTVETLNFTNILQLGDARWSRYHFDRAFSRLHSLGNSLHNSSIQHIIFPVNISQVHWAVFSIDAEMQTIAYGDSLRWSWPASYVDTIQLWLKNHGFTPFSKVPMAHSNQIDSFSCAIAAINTIKHAVFKHPLFTDDKKYCLRMEEFLVLARSHFEVHLHD